MSLMVNSKPARGRARGFSLMELMVTVAIVGVIAAVAMPSYMQYVLRTHRTNAKAILGETAQYMERYFTTNNTYAGAAVTSTVSPKNASGSAVRYNISFVTAPTATAYTVQAVPAGAQAGESCGTLTVSNTGAQTPTTAGCW